MCRGEFQRPPLPVGFKRDLLGFDGENFGQCVKALTDGHDVCCVVACGGFYDGFRGRAVIYRQKCSQ